MTAWLCFSLSCYDTIVPLFTPGAVNLGLLYDRGGWHKIYRPLVLPWLSQVYTYCLMSITAESPCGCGEARCCGLLRWVCLIPAPLSLAKRLGHLHWGADTCMYILGKN